MNAKEQEIVNNIISLKQSSADSRLDLESKFEKWYQLANQVLPSDSVYPWRSKVFVPEVQKVMDTVHPIFMDMLFAQETPFKVKGVSGDIDKNKADALNELIKVYIDKMEMYEGLDDFVKEMLTIGTAFAKLTWRKSTCQYEEEVEEEVPETFEFMGQLVPTGNIKLRSKKVTKTKVLKDSPEFEWISWKDIFVSSKAKSLRDTWVIHRSYKTLDELKQINAWAIDHGLDPIYKNLKDIDLLTDSHSANDNGEQVIRDIKEELGISVDNADKAKHLQEAQKLNKYGEIELLEYWSQDGQKVQTVAAGQVLIYDAENPYRHKQKPFLYSNYIKRPGEIWGKGIIEICEDSIDHLNTVTNQAIDSNSLIDNLMLLVSRDAGINIDQCKAKPGGIIEIDTELNEPLQNKVQQLVFQKVDTTQQQAIAREDIREVSGASKFMQGTYESGAIRSGTQGRQIQAAGNKKFMGKVLTFESMFLKPFIRMFYSLLGQYMTDQIAVRILDDQQKVQSIQMTYKDIIEDVDLIPIGSRQLAEMEILVHQLTNLLSVAAGIPNGQTLINYPYLLRKIAENLGIPSDELNQIVLSPEQQKMEMMKSMALNAGPSIGGETPVTGVGQPNLGGGFNG